ncbi:MAG: hypothetical protein IKP00_05895 [Victivallales bacterium]|nr:hypothetical protein [Victivallales bacterium]
MDQSTPRIHAQTLAELNHCVGTARRDAACQRLGEIIEREKWPEDREERAKLYARCLVLVEQALEATNKSTLLFSNPKQALGDKPLIHFLKMLDQLLNMLKLLAEHVGSVMNEAELLSEMLGAETYSILQTTCEDFEQHEQMAQQVLQSTMKIGKEMVQRNTEIRRQFFSADDNRRYEKALSEYTMHYREGIDRI